MVWTNLQKTGVSILDRDAAILAKQGQILHQAVEDKCAKTAQSTIKFIMDYLPQALIREERLMVLQKYPGAKTHRADHRDIIEQVTNAAAQSRSMPLRSASMLADTLSHWIESHVVSFDHDLAIHLRSNKRSIDTGPTEGHPRDIDWASLRVMIVEASLNNRATTKRMVRSMGVGTILEAKEFAQALRIMKDEPVDLILAEEDLPPMDGPGMARELRDTRYSPNPEAILILLAGHDMQKGHLETCLQAGLHGVILKPISQANLAARMRRLLAFPLPFRTEGSQRLPVHPERIPDAKTGFDLGAKDGGDGMTVDMQSSRNFVRSRTSAAQFSADGGSHAAKLPNRLPPPPSGDAWGGFGED